LSAAGQRGGRTIECDDRGNLVVPADPVIPWIEGDGTGPDIWRGTRPVLDAAVERAYRGARRIVWREVLVGEKALRETGKLLPEESLEALRRYRVSIKGPLTTPVGGGFRSLNVTLRQLLDLYACIRPVRWVPGVPSPVKHPERVDMVIYRENTEDVYAGIEWPAGSPEAERLARFLREELGANIPPRAGLGVKPISEGATRRIVRLAILDAIRDGRRSVTLVHKGNIMKFTEGAFRDWGYALAREEFADRCVAEADLGGAAPPAGRIVVKDRIADSMFQQVLLRPEEYEHVATPNLNGDYLSDALAAQVGGLGMAPGGNLGDGVALFEATHGSAPKYAGLDKVNPSSLILSGALMLRHMGWKEAAEGIEEALRRTVAQKRVTYDLARQIEGARELRCSEFGAALVENLP